jgi:hypothetical protein
MSDTGPQDEVHGVEAASPYAVDSGVKAEKIADRFVLMHSQFD